MSATIYRATAFLFSIACYGVFLLVFLYLLAFLANLQTTPLADDFPAIRALVPTLWILGATWVRWNSRCWWISA